MLKIFKTAKELNLTSVRRMYMDNVVAFATRPEEGNKYNPIGLLLLIMKEPSEVERRRIDDVVNKYVGEGYEVRFIIGSNMKINDNSDKNKKPK